MNENGTDNFGSSGNTQNGDIGSPFSLSSSNVSYNHHYLWGSENDALSANECL